MRKFLIKIPYSHGIGEKILLRIICKVDKNIEASVRAYWNQVAPNQSDEELQKCLGTYLPFYSVSDNCMGHVTKIAYSCAAKKGEDLQTQITLTSVLEKTMTKQKTSVV